MIPVNDQCLIAQRRRTAFTEAHLHLHVAKIFRPDRVSFHVQAEDTAGSERSEEVFAVCHGRWGSPCSITMCALMRGFRSQCALPSNCAVLALICDSLEALNLF